MTCRHHHGTTATPPPATHRRLRRRPRWTARERSPPKTAADSPAAPPAQLMHQPESDSCPTNCPITLVFGVLLVPFRHNCGNTKCQVVVLLLGGLGTENRKVGGSTPPLATTLTSINGCFLVICVPCTSTSCSNGCSNLIRLGDPQACVAPGVVLRERRVRRSPWSRRGWRVRRCA